MKLLKGFSLIELMISVLIVGILAAIAYPAYMKSVQKGNRAEAKSGLTQVVQRLQRCYSNYGTFIHADCTVHTELTTGDKEIFSEGREFYSIKFKEVEATKYTLEATAVLPPQTNDKSSTLDCTKLTLNHTGSKGDSEECWR